MSTTLHRCMTSRKNTVAAESKRPTPMQKNMSRIRQTGSSSRCQVGTTWNHSMTMATAISEKAKFTSENKTFCTGKTKRCTLTFLSSEDA